MCIHCNWSQQERKCSFKEPEEFTIAVFFCYFFRQSSVTHCSLISVPKEHKNPAKPHPPILNQYQPSDCVENYWCDHWIIDRSLKTNGVIDDIQHNRVSFRGRGKNRTEELIYEIVMRWWNYKPMGKSEYEGNGRVSRSSDRPGGTDGSRTLGDMYDLRSDLLNIQTRWDSKTDFCKKVVTHWMFTFYPFGNIVQKCICASCYWYIIITTHHTVKLQLTLKLALYFCFFCTRKVIFLSYSTSSTIRYSKKNESCSFIKC